MRYSEALGLFCDLKAVTVSTQDRAAARGELLALLGRWSPQVEACPFDEAAFWVGAGGLAGLYGSEAQWGASIRAALADHRYRAVVVVGQSRAGTYVLAKARRRSTVVRSPEAEARAFDQAPLTVFPLGRRHRRLLDRLGLKTLAGVRALGADELARRFGPDLVRDLRVLEALADLPLQTAETAPGVSRRRRLESPLADRAALGPLLDDLVADGLADLGRRGRLVEELRLVFVLETFDLLSEVLRPAEPTVSRATLSRLLELRLARIEFPTGVLELRVSFGEVGLPPGSGDLFAPPVVRDLKKGAEALAVLRAQWGNDAVVRPVLVDSHRPDQAFCWEPVEKLRAPQPGPAATEAPTAVRRIRWGGKAWTGNPAGQRLGSACRFQAASAGAPVDQEFWFLRTARREVVWVSWDRAGGQAHWVAVVD